MLIQILLLGEGLLGRTPVNPQRFGCANGSPFVLRNHAYEIALGYRLYIAGNLFGGGVVHTHQFGADTSRPNHAAM